MEKIDISSLPLPQLTEWVTGTLGEPKFRAGQIYRWVHQKRVGSFAEMTNLSAVLRQKLEQSAFLTVLSTRRRLESLRRGKSQGEVGWKPSVRFRMRRRAASSANRRRPAAWPDEPSFPAASSP